MALGCSAFAHTIWSPFAFLAQIPPWPASRTRPEEGPGTVTFLICVGHYRVLFAHNQGRKRECACVWKKEDDVLQYQIGMKETKTKDMPFSSVKVSLRQGDNKH